MDSGSTFPLPGREDTVVQGPVVKVGKGCDVPCRDFGGNVNVLSRNHWSNDFPAGLVGSALRRAGDDEVPPVEGPRLGRCRGHAGGGYLAIGNLSS